MPAKFKLLELTIEGETKLATQWVKDPRCEVTYGTLSHRAKRGWPHNLEILKHDPRNYAGKRQFRAFLPDGTCIGEFASIRKATEAINQSSKTGRIEWWFRGIEIPIPRPPKGPGRGRGSTLVTAWGETKTAAEWANDPRCKVAETTLYNRLRQTRKIWRPEKAMTTPPKELYVRSRAIARSKRYGAFGEKKVLTEWARDPRCVVSVGLLRKRVREGMRLKEALTKPGDPRFQGRAADSPKLNAFGERKTMAQWSRDPRSRVGYKVLRDRLRRGMSLEQALTQATDSNIIRAEAFGEVKTLKQWVADPRCLVPLRLLRHRLEVGMPAEKALTFQREIKIEAFGEVKTHKEWAADPRCQVSRHILWKRIRGGMEPEAAILLRTDDAKKGKQAFGESKPLFQWLNDPRRKMPAAEFLARLEAGEPLEQLLRRKSSKIRPATRTTRRPKTNKPG